MSYTAAQRIGIYTIAFVDPYAANHDNNRFDTLNATVAFQDRILGNIQTLSTKGVGAATDPYGILYLPDLQTDACRDQERAHVPVNATRQADLPTGMDYALIAIAPWYSAQCTLEYFTAARDAPTKAFFTFQPGQSDAQPPVLHDAAWNLQDGGSWQSANTFPTYALSSMTGGVIMHQLEQYSGNVSDVPNGDALSKIYPSSQYVRLWATVSTGMLHSYALFPPILIPILDSGAQLPSLWVFLVIVLAILVLAVSLTSLTMHILQRRRRTALRQRVVNGEIDLEALGVKRLTVSQELLDKFPIYPYTVATAHPTLDLEKTTPHAPDPTLHLPSSADDAETGNKTSPLYRPSSAPTIATSGMSTSWSQPTCPICLDDFELNDTQVRELPCRHVFHPECIDTFLLRNSSLCPMCKQSVLPKGDCPVKITNTMVRRERHISRMRARGANTTNGTYSVAPPSYMVTDAPAPSSRPPDAFASLGSRLGGVMAGRRIFSAPERTRTTPTDIEMAHTSNPAMAPGTTPPPSQTPATPFAPPARPTTQDCSPTNNRREWARQRALAMLGTRHAASNDAPDEDTSSRWRRTFRNVFPGFR